MVMALRNSTFLIQDNKTLKEMEEDLGGILTMVKKHIPSDGGLRKVGRTDSRLKRFKRCFK